MIPQPSRRYLTAARTAALAVALAVTLAGLPHATAAPAGPAPGAATSAGPPPDAATSTGPVPDAAADRLIVVLEEGAATPAQLRNAGRGQRLARLGVLALTVDPAAREQTRRALARLPGVARVENDPVATVAAVTPNDPLWPHQWGAARVGLPDAWQVTTGAPETVVAVLDTGVDADHPDLAGGVLPGRNTLDASAGTTDWHGHGTLVAGVIAARGGNGAGGAGVCWTCTILPVKVLGDDGFGSTATVAEGIVWAVDQGATVLNLSLGSTATSAALDAAVAYAAERDVLVVAAAGNDGSTERLYPAAHPAAVAVAGSDETDGRYTWSNHGADWVDLAAPGCNLATTVGGGYGIMCGTSSAAPLVSGVAALARTAEPAWSAAQVTARLHAAAVDVGGWVAHGRLAAAGTLLPPPPPNWCSAAGTPLSGDWNGNGRSTPGCWEDGFFYLRLSLSDGGADRRIRFGRAGDTPVVGDWNGNGRTGIGVVRNERRWLLRNNPGGGPAQRDFVFGRAGDTPVVGDWNGNGRDGVGVVRADRWLLRNTANGGTVQHDFRYGRAGDTFVTGDWNGNGRDGVGVVRGNRWLLRNPLSAGAAQRDFRYGRAADAKVAGDWNRNGRDGVGVVRDDRWLLRNALSDGEAWRTLRLR